MADERHIEVILHELVDRTCVKLINAVALLISSLTVQSHSSVYVCWYNNKITAKVQMGIIKNCQQLFMSLSADLVVYQTLCDIDKRHAYAQQFLSKYSFFLKDLFSDVNSEEDKIVQGLSNFDLYKTLAQISLNRSINALSNEQIKKLKFCVLNANPLIFPENQTFNPYSLVSTNNAKIDVYKISTQKDGESENLKWLCKDSVNENESVDLDGDNYIYNRIYSFP